jgi:hypothetical protein
MERFATAGLPPAPAAEERRADNFLILTFFFKLFLKITPGQHFLH